MTNPTSRRVLIAGLAPDAVLARMSAFGALYGDGSFPLTHRWTFAAREARGDWVQLDVPPALPVRHFHNLATWLALDPARPREVILTSSGEGAWDYWLTRCADPELEYVLGGATGKGLPFQVDVVSGNLFDHPQTRVPPLPTGLALLTRGVHVALHRPDPDVPDAGAVELAMPPLPSPPWVIPEPANLADEFAITRIQPQGGFARMVDWLLGR